MIMNQVMMKMMQITRTVRRTSRINSRRTRNQGWISRAQHLEWESNLNRWPCTLLELRWVPMSSSK